MRRAVSRPAMLRESSHIRLDCIASVRRRSSARLPPRSPAIHSPWPRRCQTVYRPLRRLTHPRPQSRAPAPAAWAIISARTINRSLNPPKLNHSRSPASSIFSQPIDSRFPVATPSAAPLACKCSSVASTPGITRTYHRLTLRQHIAAHRIENVLKLRMPLGVLHLRRAKGVAQNSRIGIAR